MRTGNAGQSQIGIQRREIKRKKGKTEDKLIPGDLGDDRGRRNYGGEGRCRQRGSKKRRCLRDETTPCRTHAFVGVVLL